MRQVDRKTFYDRTLHFHRSHLMTCDDDYPSPCHPGGSTCVSGKQQKVLLAHLDDRSIFAIPQEHEGGGAGRGAKKAPTSQHQPPPSASSTSQPNSASKSTKTSSPSNPGKPTPPRSPATHKSPGTRKSSAPAKNATTKPNQSWNVSTESKSKSTHSPLSTPR